MRFWLSILYLSLIACNSKPKTNHVVSPDTLVTQRTTGSALTDDSYYFFPSDTVKYPVHLLGVRGYHNEEVWEDAEKEKWQGLFFNGTNWYVAAVNLNKEKAHDEIVDEEKTDSTAWIIRVNNTDTALILFSGYRVPEGKKETIDLKSTDVLPGDSVHFNFNGARYTLFATGKRIYEDADRKYFNLADYKLFIQGTKNGTLLTQAIMIQPHFDEKFPSILFIGDIDGDDFPDLLLDTSNDSNAEVPTLYLSKPAKGKELLKVMGLHVSVGC